MPESAGPRMRPGTLPPCRAESDGRAVGLGSRGSAGAGFPVGDASQPRDDAVGRQFVHAGQVSNASLGASLSVARGAANPCCH